MMIMKISILLLWISISKISGQFQSRGKQLACLQLSTGMMMNVAK